MKAFIPLFIVLFALSPHARAVETIVNGTASFDTTEPTSSDIANWETGWGAGGITGWDYVGRVNDGGGVYLGNGWVITAGHVGGGNFVLSSGTYDLVAGSEQSITSGTEVADLTLFQIATNPDLPSLTIGSTPHPLSDYSQGSQVAMIGYGGVGESWGLNTVTCVDETVEVGGYSFETTDFETAFGTTTTDNTNSATNNAVLYSGDSGGGDFIYSSRRGIWTLSGINEALDDSNDSYMVQLSAYASQINQITSASPVPEPSSYGLLALAVLLVGRIRRNCRERLAKGWLGS